MDTINWIFKTVITSTKHKPTIVCHLLLTNLPIIFGSLVKIINGNKVNGRAILKTTWAYTIIFSKILSSKLTTKPIIKIGIKVITLVKSLLCHKGNLICKYPSITICPDKVLVIEEIRPVINSAKANKYDMIGFAKLPTTAVLFNPWKTDIRLANWSDFLKKTVPPKINNKQLMIKE